MRITLNPSKLQLVKEEISYDILNIESTENKITLTLEDDYTITFNRCKGFLNKHGEKCDLDVLLNREELSLNIIPKSVKIFDMPENNKMLQIILKR